MNVSKTHYIVFTRKLKSATSLNIGIDDKIINEGNKTKFLGVIIDKKLTWKEHISYLSSKISRGIDMIIKAKKRLNKDALVTLYYSFIYPYMTYCNHICGTACHDVQFSCAIYQPLLAHHWRVHQCLLTSRFIAPSIPWGVSAPGGKMWKQLLKDRIFLNNSPIFTIEISAFIHLLFKKHCIQYISI